jgi:hypothetical protein
MNMNTSYLIYQSERSRTVAEQRAIDCRTGELAASLSRRLSSLATLGRRRHLRHLRPIHRQPSANCGRPEYVR